MAQHEGNSVDQDVGMMLLGMLHQPGSELTDEEQMFPRNDADDYAHNIKYGLDRDRFVWAGRELGRALDEAGIDIHPSVEVLMGHEVGARITFGACRHLLKARGVDEAELDRIYQSDSAVRMREFRAQLKRAS